MPDPWIPGTPTLPPADPQDGYLWFDAAGAPVSEPQWEGWGIRLA
jgi:hypothetical protein